MARGGRRCVWASLELSYQGQPATGRLISLPYRESLASIRQPRLLVKRLWPALITFPLARISPAVGRKSSDPWVQCELDLRKTGAIESCLALESQRWLRPSRMARLRALWPNGPWRLDSSQPHYKVDFRPRFAARSRCPEDPSDHSRTNLPRRSVLVMRHRSRRVARDDEILSETGRPSLIHCAPTCPRLAATRQAS
jgi:hypothetical protein